LWGTGAPVILRFKVAPITMSVHFNPRLAITTGCLLAFMSAGVNACYLIGVGTSVSHLTGDVSRVAQSIIQGESSFLLAFHLVLATAGFLLGAVLAGYAIHHPSVEFTRPYGRAVVGIGLCLTVAHALFVRAPQVSIALAGVACGFQNALATRYRGIILRTTHVTGLLTDLGTNLGMRLKGHEIAAWKLLVPALIIGSFFAGAMAGCWAYALSGGEALLGYAGAYVGLGTLWIVYRLRRRRSEG
jgi:uncharacterized membrane protein YoaK (UPF0700 family)